MSRIPWKGLNRRALFRGGGLLAASSALLRGRAFAAPIASGLRIGPDIYASIGVRTVINCQGDKTILGGSLTLPEVKRAMDEASRHFVHMDELMEAVGARLAQLTGAEWGVVTSGCAAAIAGATAACIAGGDPEKLQRLPNLEGLKNEVVVPAYCRNMYDHAVRMVGVKMVEVENKDQLELALGPQTAMMYVFHPQDPFGLDVITSIARRKGVPVFVDAAAEDLTFRPNLYLQRGATLVGYSGGKVIHGPQCAGLLLGRKDLVKAAFLNSAPHHAFARPMKVGKEEVVGMLAAVEAWMKRDMAAEMKMHQSWVEHIAARVTKVPGVKAEISHPEPVLRPMLRIAWDGARVGITGQEIEKLLADSTPRIIMGRGFGSRRGSLDSSISLSPSMLSPGEEKVVADRLYALLSNPPQPPAVPAPHATPAVVSGQWSLHLDFVSGSADHTLLFEQQGRELRGSHRGQFVAGDLRGEVDGHYVRFMSSQPIESTWLRYGFEGTLEGDTMHGTVDLDEYGTARWSAKRHTYVQPGGEPFTRPLKKS